ncbi:MAG TPA: TonB-dependent receptor [Bryobacteraceae bacterium]|nr:TonB-dependent receptor [Bryobacteraceae bacterium]
MNTCRARKFAMLAFLFAALAAAQEFRATVTGRVLDATGAGVAGAKITATNNQTNVTAEATTTEAGDYTIPFLTPGTYTVRVEAPGFKSSLREKIELFVNDRKSVDFSLEIGNVQETVTITADAPMLDETTAQRGGVIENLRVTELPLNGRNPFQLATLTPGVIFAGNPQFTRPFDNGDNANFSISGGLRQTNEFLIDGAPDNAVTDTAGDRTRANQNVAYIPTVDATQEFKIIQNLYDSQYGRTGGGVINVTTKSGTNELHGTAYDFIRRYQLDANSFSQNASGLPRYARDPVTGANLGGRKLDQWGGVLNGPIVLPKLYNGKDRTFFMFGVEQYDESTPSPGIVSVPSLAERNGDFSRTGLQIFDPFSTRLNPSFNSAAAESATNPRYIRDPFPNNIIPTNRLNPAGLAIARSFPEPNTGAADARFNNYNVGPNLSADTFRNWIGRVDHSIGPSQRLFFRYAQNRREQVDNGFQNFTGPGLDAQGPLVRTNNNAVVDSVTVLNANMILNLRGAFTRYIEEARRQRVYGLDISTLGFSPQFTNSRFDPIPPRIEVDQYPTWGTRNQRYNVSNILSFQPSLSVITGKHSIKFGSDIRDLRVNTASGSFIWGAGQFRFTRDFTQRIPNIAENNSGAALASLLLGAPAGGVIQQTPALAYRWGYYGLYFQDDYRITDRLTLNLGLRWDMETAPTERYNRQNRGFATNEASPLAAAARAADPANCPACANLTGGLLFAGVNGNGRGAFKNDLNNWQPRIGAAYRLRDRTVLRGGFGVFYLPEAAFGGVAGFAADTQFISTVGGGAEGFTPATLLSNPFPGGYIQPTGASLGLNTFAGGNVIYTNPNRVIPRVHQWSFGVQHQLPWSVRVDASYVGSRSYDINTGTNQAGGARNINVNSAEQLARARQDSNYLNQPVANPFAGLLPGTSLNAATVPRSQLLKPFPQFNDVVVSGESVGKIWYDALQLSVEKRYTSGLVMVLAYTWSKNLEQIAFLNPQDARPTKNLAARDIPHRLVFSGVWQLPFGIGRQYANNIGRGWNYLIGGWEYNWIATVQSGLPVDLPGNVDIIGDITAQDQTSNFWFNPCVANVAGTAATRPNDAHSSFNTPCNNPAWQLRGPFTLRTTPFRTGAIRTPTEPQFDMSINKRFNFTERFNAQFRFEMFNAFNTAVRSGPNMSSTDPNFAIIPPSTTNFARQIQLGFKFNF